MKQNLAAHFSSNELSGSPHLTLNQSYLGDTARFDSQAVVRGGQIRYMRGINNSRGEY